MICIVTLATTLVVFNDELKRLFTKDEETVRALAPVLWLLIAQLGLSGFNAV